MGGHPSKPDYTKSLQVIGAGMSRTGTASMQLALERLLDGPVSHGGSGLMNGENEPWGRKWLSLLRAERKGEKERALKLLRDVTAGFVGYTDYPAISVLPLILELYPDVKVVLVTRDREKWWKSFEHVIGHATSWLQQAVVMVLPGIRLVGPFTDEFILSMTHLVESAGKKPGNFGPWLLDAHNEMVMEQIPKEQLLVMDLNEGWEPLCEFLGKPVPDEPFPRVNDSAAIDAQVKEVLLKAGLVWLGIFATLGSIVYSGLWLWKNKFHR